MQHPDHLRYTKDHEWVLVEGDVATVGITHHAQEALGDVVYVELPAAGSRVSQGVQFGTVESVKAVSELFAPISGEVIESNTSLGDRPESVNRDPHGEGWMLKVRFAAADELAQLLDASSYESLLQG